MKMCLPHVTLLTCCIPCVYLVDTLYSVFATHYIVDTLYPGAYLVDVWYFVLPSEPGREPGGEQPAEPGRRGGGGGRGQPGLLHAGRPHLPAGRRHALGAPQRHHRCRHHVQRGRVRILHAPQPDLGDPLQARSVPS